MKKAIFVFTFFFISNISFMSHAMDRGAGDGSVVRDPAGIGRVHSDGRSRLLLRGPVDNREVRALNIRHGMEVESQGVLWRSPFMIISLLGLPSDAMIEEYRQVRGLTLRYSVYRPASSGRP